MIEILVNDLTGQYVYKENCLNGKRLHTNPNCLTNCARKFTYSMSDNKLDAGKQVQ